MATTDPGFVPPPAEIDLEGARPIPEKKPRSWIAATILGLYYAIRRPFCHIFCHHSDRNRNQLAMATVDSDRASFDRERGHTATAKKPRIVVSTIGFFYVLWAQLRRLFGV
jgi:hypothetical protein